MMIRVREKENPGLLTATNKNQALTTGVQLYKIITEVTNDCLWERDLNTTEILWIDGGHKRTFGYPVENDHVTLTFWESCIHPEDRVRVLSKLNHAINSGENPTWEDEYRFRRIDGSYLFVADRARITYDQNKKAICLTGATQDISERILLQQKLDQEKAISRKKITQAILEAQENEKAEVGRRLYDEIGQILAASKMYLQQAATSESHREENIHTSLQYIRTVMTEINQLAKSLVIPPFHIVGLFDNIRNFITDTSAKHGLHISFSIDSLVEDQLTPGLQQTIFRIIQEQTNNILKHSGGGNALIDLSMKENNVVLLISDNGIGCDSKTENDGLGLTSIKCRAEINNGSAVVWSQPGEGYFLTVKLPLADPLH